MLDDQAEFVDKLVGGLDRATDKVDNAILASRQGNWFEKLSAAVFGIDGFDLYDLNKAFDVLYKEKIKTQAFIIKRKIFQEAPVQKRHYKPVLN